MRGRQFKLRGIPSVVAICALIGTLGCTKEIVGPGENAPSNSPPTGQTPQAPSAPTCAWCAVTIDFGGGLPTGWQSKVRGGGNAGLVNGRMEARQTDSGVEIGSAANINGAASALDVSFDLGVPTSSWGATTAVTLATATSSFVLAIGCSQNPLGSVSSCLPIGFTSARASSGSSGSLAGVMSGSSVVEFGRQRIAAATGTYKLNLNFTDGTVAFAVTTGSGANVGSGVLTLSGMRVGAITGFYLDLYETVGDVLWLDNLTVRVR